MHPLDGAYERVNGAWEHLDALKPDISSFAKTVADKVTLDYKKEVVQVGDRKIEAPVGTATAPGNVPAPPKLGRLISETIQNLRIALDYLIYELACFDSKRIVDNTQFVIVDSEEQFRKNLWHLSGLSGLHIEMVQRLQPYAGCDWTKLLRDLSNPDKHRQFTVFKHPIVFRLDSRNTEAILAGKQVDVDSYTSIQITFNDGPPVVEGLEQLVLDVTHALDIFKPEFKR